jgi:hypothetical protein
MPSEQYRHLNPLKVHGRDASKHRAIPILVSMGRYRDHVGALIAGEPRQVEYGLGDDTADLDVVSRVLEAVGKIQIVPCHGQFGLPVDAQIPEITTVPFQPRDLDDPEQDQRVGQLGGQPHELIRRVRIVESDDDA